MKNRAGTFAWGMVLGCWLAAAPPPAAAVNCNILTGGNPCAAGCPDECSPILCPANALCRSACGGSGCNVGCSPGPCGAGCPDECSPILCPANALCRADCGGSGCNVGCSPGPCGAGCPDECSFVLCPANPCSCSESGEPCAVSANCCGDLVCAFPQQVCRHDPSTLGEPCGPLAPCADGLRCIGLVCQPPRVVGEGCLVGSDCADGLDCRPCFVEGCRAPLMCFPRGEQRLFGEAECLAYHSDALAAGARGSGIATTYGYGSAIAAAAGASFEMGTAYGPDGEYGCYLTTCVGGIADAEIGSFVSVGFYDAFTSLPGSSVAIVEEAGDGLSFSTSQIIGGSGALIGTADCLSIEASLAPITAGVFDCDTVVNAFSVAPPPTTTSTTLPPGITTTSVTSTSTTTSTSSTLPSLTVPELLELLGRALPPPGAERRSARRTADKLARLLDVAARRVQAADTASGRQRLRRYRKARKALRKMQAVARRSGERGRLGVPEGPIVTLAQALLARLPAS